MSPSVPQAIGPYRLLKVLGEGGMGTVYLAEQQELIRRRVALKLVRPGLDSREVIARFEAERQALAMMNHSAIAKVLDAGWAPDGRPYFVMEWVDGQPVTEYAESNGLTIEERLQLFLKICQGIQHAHQKAIIHRDLKPSNILVAFQDSRHVPKIIDFGIAKALGAQTLTDKTVHTQMGQIVGTPHYISPEQADSLGKDVDTRTDVYSLGAILYELLTDVPPLDLDEASQGGVLSVQKHLLECEPLRPSVRLGQMDPEMLDEVARARKVSREDLLHEVNSDLDWVVMKALEKDRERRYTSASMLEEDIVRFLHCEPVLAGPPSTRYRLRKFAQRNRWKVAAVGLTSIALILGSVISVWQAIRATNYANLAETRLHNERGALAEANAAREEAEAAFAQSDYQTGQQMASRSRYGEAIAYLCRSLTRRPDNATALNRLYSILTQSRHVWQTMTPMRHREPVTQIALSSDGAFVATATGSGGIALWRAAHPPEKLWTYEYGDIPSALEFTPDDQFLLLGGYTGGRKLRVADGMLTDSILESKVSDWLGFEFSADGDRVLTSSWHRGAALWSTGRLQPLLTLDHLSLRSATFSSDESLILTASQTGRDARLWRAEDGTMLKRFRHSREIWKGWFSPDDQHVLVAASDGKAYLWSIGSGAAPVRVFDHGSEHVMRTAAFSPDGKWLVTGCADHTARVWEVASGRELSRIQGRSEFIALGFVERDRLFTVEKAGSVRTWRLQDGRAIAESSMELEGLINDVCWNSESNQLGIAGAGEMHARVLQLTSACPPLLFPQGHVTASCLTNGGETVFAGTARGRLVTMDADEGAVRALHDFHSPVSAVASHPHDSGEVFAGTAEGDVLKWRFDEGEKKLQALRLAETPVNHLATRDCGELLAAATDNEAFLIDVSEWKALPLPQVGRVTALSFQPQGNLLGVGADTGVVTVWDVAAKEVRYRLKHHGEVRQVAWSPDGETIATGAVYPADTGDQTICLWSGVDGRSMGKTMKHSGLVTALAFDAEGRRLLSGTEADGVVIWNVSSQKPLTRLAPPGRVRDAVLSPDGRWCAILSRAEAEGTLTVWHAGTGDPISADLRVGPWVDQVRFTPDSQRVLVSPANAGQSQRNAAVSLWPVILNGEGHALGPLVEHALQVGGRTFDDQGKWQPVPSWEKPLPEVGRGKIGMLASWLSAPVPGRRSSPLIEPDTQALREATAWQLCEVFGPYQPQEWKRAVTAAWHRDVGAAQRHVIQAASKQASEKEPALRFAEVLHYCRAGDSHEALFVCSEILQTSDVAVPDLWAVLNHLEEAGTGNYAVKARILSHLLGAMRHRLSDQELWQAHHRLLLLNIHTGFFDKAITVWRELVHHPVWLERHATTALAERLMHASVVRAEVERSLGNMPQANHLWLVGACFRKYMEVSFPTATPSVIAANTNRLLASLKEALSPSPGEAGKEAMVQVFEELAFNLPTDHAFAKLTLCLRDDVAGLPSVEEDVQLWLARAELQRVFGRTYDISAAPLVGFLNQALPKPAPSIELLLERGFRRPYLQQKLLSYPLPQSDEAPYQMLQLTNHYNVNLFEEYTWHGRADEMLARLPQVLAKESEMIIPFDVKGLIQLAGSQIQQAADGSVYPHETMEIACTRTVKRVHLLLGLLNGTASTGTPILHLIVKYQDGSRSSVELNYGEHMVDWKSSWVPNPNRALFVNTEPGKAVQLTHVICENPHPDKALQSIGFRTAGATGAPFILGITVD